MKIFDGFIFNDELDLLELRLMELSDYVDEFVLVEMAHNFMQQPKPLHYNDNQARFSKWSKQIRHIIVRNYQVEPHPAMEYHQRRMIAAGLLDVGPQDVVMAGDLDEIPSREVVESVRRLPPDHLFLCMQQLYYYYVDCEQAAPWGGTIIGPKWAFGADMDFQQVRFDRYNLPRLDKAGWHFSWLGPLEHLQSKLDSIDVDLDAKLYGSTDIVKPASSDVTFLKRCLDTGEDLFGRTSEISKKTFVPIEPGIRQPHVIREWLAKHPQYAHGEANADHPKEQQADEPRRRGRPKGSKNRPKFGRMSHN